MANQQTKKRKPPVRNELNTQEAAHFAYSLIRFWRTGDWKSIISLQHTLNSNTPEYDVIVAAAASACVQMGNFGQAISLTHKALRHSVSKATLTTALYAGLQQRLEVLKDLSGLKRTIPSSDESRTDLSQLFSTPATDLSVKKTVATIRARHQLLWHYLDSELLSPPLWLGEIVRENFETEDILSAIGSTIKKYQVTDSDLFWFYLCTSDEFIARKDRLTALHYVKEAKNVLNSASHPLAKIVIKKLLRLGDKIEAADLLYESSIEENGKLFSDTDKQLLKDVIADAFSTVRTKQAHGQEVLLKYLDKHLKKIPSQNNGEPLTIIEIGTTRENIPGQGSTQIIAEFCKKRGLNFLTVDMDPHNTIRANVLFKQMKTSFQAINQKGEDFLREQIGPFDFIFLDAYDFDHGKHSSIRQQRYDMYLGSRIDDEKCHQMHLECAVSIKEKLSEYGLVCIDDAWIEKGNWRAKGTTAVPYLLENGFKLLKAKNGSALLSRDGK